MKGKERAVVTMTVTFVIFPRVPCVGPMLQQHGGCIGLNVEAVFAIDAIVIDLSF